MQLITALAQTFQVTVFDIFFYLGTFFAIMTMYFLVSLRRIYEIAFGAIVGIGVYIALAVLLLTNVTLNTGGGLLPFGISVLIVSVAVYLVWILAILFPLNGSLVMNDTNNPILYVIQYIFVAVFLVFGFSAVLVYMIEQVYIFQPKTIFIYLRDWDFYQQIIRQSKVWYFLMTHQNIIIPLATILMIYKLFLSNLVSAVILSIIYNLSKVGFYRRENDTNYRVEFHEVGASADTSEHQHEQKDH